MDWVKLRAWWHHRQGLDGSLKRLSVAQVLESVGWSRSVGGANPYLAVFARNGAGRETVDAEIASLNLCELPCARGCTYVVPAAHFTLALKVGLPFCAKTEIATAQKHFQYGREESERLSALILECLGERTMDPRELKAALGDAVINFGPEGKKRGLTTSLPLSLAILQGEGKIVRVALDGRLDRQRYAYRKWSPGPLETGETCEKPFTELARRYFRWIGPATPENFQWFSGLGVADTKASLADLDLVAVEPDSRYLLLSDDLEAFRAFRTPAEPSIALVGSIDSLLLHRRNVVDHLDAVDHDQMMFGETKRIQIGSLADLTNHAIIDRGRVIGVWEYDPELQEIVFLSFVGPSDALSAVVEQTGAFISDQLGDARSFSLDSPESRKPKLAAMRAQIAMK